MNKLKKLKNLKLTDREKRELFARVKSSINKLPDSGEAHFEYPVPSPFYRYAFFPHTAFMKAGVLALLVLSFSGATAYASLGSLPGDLLYGVKINVVEKVSKIAAFTPEGRARVETVRIERRIAEFEALAEKGELTEEHTKVIEKNIDQRLKNFDRNVSVLKERTGKDKERIHEEKELDEKLERHAEKIFRIREEKTKDKHALEAVLQRVEARREEIKEEENKDANEADGDDGQDESNDNVQGPELELPTI
jgi:hypothetical protein